MKFLARLRRLFHRPVSSDVQTCTREQPHDGPCNGWPCDYIQRVFNLDDRGRPIRFIRSGFEDWKIPA